MEGREVGPFNHFVRTLRISKYVGPYILFHKFRLTVLLAIFD